MPVSAAPLYPDARTLLTNTTRDSPRKWVAEQSQHLRSNPVLRLAFPEMDP